ncbi:MAG TPA: ABC transporter permease [Gemmatimonadales bacterium]|jgi:putative ABC transport system permease protein
MSFFRQFTSGVRTLLNRSAADQDIADEVQDYYERSVASHRAKGLSPHEAARAANMELGSVAQVKEEVRSYGWENWIETTLADLRYAARRLRSSPGFTTVTILTLAVGVGATTAILSTVNRIIFHPLPYPNPERILMVWDIGVGNSRLDGTFGTYRELAERSRSFETMATVKPWQPTLNGGAEPEMIDGQRVTASYFSVLGVKPILGRDFEAVEDRADGPRVVILSDGLWRRRFGADPTIVGRTITLSDNPYLVAGVMPKGFSSSLAPSAELWSTLQYDMTQGRAWGHHLRIVGRLRPGVSIEQAKAEVGQIAKNRLAEYPRPEWAEVRDGFIVASLQDDITRGVKPALFLILGAVVLVLAIACVNVTNLLLARGVQRTGEFALRAALGAGRQRLVRQLLTESLLLAAMGGLAGMAVAVLGVRALVALSPAGLPRASEIGVDGTVFVFGAIVTTLIGLLVGISPALQASRNAPQENLRFGSRRTTGGHKRLRSILVVAEVTLAVVLLVCSGLLLRSLRQLFAVEAGFNPSGLLTMQIQVTGHQFDDDSAAKLFLNQSVAAVRQVPGVTSAALTSQLPLSGAADQYGVFLEASPEQGGGEQSPFRYSVTPGYLETMGIPLRRGRLLDEHDVAGSPRVALISESLARHRLPGVDPIGQHLTIGDETPYTVVGVVGDVRQVSLAVDQADAVYTTEDQWRFTDRAISLVVKSRGNPLSLVPAVQEAVWSVDPGQAIVRIATMDHVVAASAAERRFALTLFEAFAVAALVLAAAGIYGVLSGSVVERRQEIGVRSALGATRRDILSLVVGQGMTLTGFGVLVGLAGAAAISQVLVAMLFGVSHLDPMTYLGAMAVLAGVGLVACAVPAWRATRVDPATTLRAE